MIIFCILKIISDQGKRLVTSVALLGCIRIGRIERGVFRSLWIISYSELGGLLIFSFVAWPLFRTFSATFSVAPVIPVSSFRDVKGIGVVSPLPAGPSATVVEGNQPVQNVITILFHLLPDPV